MRSRLAVRFLVLWALLLTLALLGPVASAAPGAVGTITEFPIPTPYSNTWDITAGPDGSLWFAEEGAAKIGRITPAGVITEFPLTPRSAPRSITAGPDGNLWFTESAVNKVGRITPSGVIAEFVIPQSCSLWDI